MRIRKNVIALIILLCTGGPVWIRSAEITKEEKKTFSLPPNGLVSLAADLGNVTVSSVDGENIVLSTIKAAWGRDEKETQKRMEDLEVVIEQTGNRLYIQERDRSLEDRRNRVRPFDFLGGESRKTRAAVDFTLQIPKTVRLYARTDEGNIDVTGTGGDTDVETDEGDIHLDGMTSNRIHAVADEGNIRIRDLKTNGKGFLSAETDEGNIRLEAVDVQTLELTVDEGEAILRDLLADQMTLSCDEGGILADVQPRPAGKYRIESDEGDVRVTIPGNADMSVYLETGQGHIDSDFPMTALEKGEGQKMEGELGKGGALLKVVAQEGDIVLRAKTATGR